jgi:hypothetical protein
MSTLSDTQLNANVANALLSTGPRTEEGKQRSSQNAVSHAIFAKTIPDADRQNHERLLLQHRQDFLPHGEIEEQFVVTIADTQWRLARCRELQDSLLFAGIDAPDQQLDALNKYSLYEQRLTRVLQTNLRQLREIQKERKEREETELKNAAKICKSLGDKQNHYEPAEDGFVFSKADLALWMRRNDRLESAKRDGFNSRFFGK